ncbi:MAG: ABC transporter substrate-binding protein [Desulfobacteraceae bacterium]|nr:ABC transporter substrate-binding protein [Desulfobacteraceae bacterium]
MENIIMNKLIFFLTIMGFWATCALADPPFQRVISLSPIITKTIYLLGAQEKLIANTTYCNIPAQARFKEKIGSVIQMNIEKIISLEPDLVISSALSREKQLIILEKQSIPLLRTHNPKTFEQICEMTLKIGNALGKAQEARLIVDKARNKANKILQETLALKKPKVFLQIGLKPLHSANKEMFINEYIRYTGGINIAAEESSGIYSRERVIRENPDLILIATMGTSKKAGELEKQGWMSFKSINAVKKNRVHVVDPEWICSPTPSTFIKGLKLILPLVHPEVKFNEP